MKEMVIGTLLTLVVVMGFNNIKNSGISFGANDGINTLVTEFRPQVIKAFDDAEKEHLDEVIPGPAPGPNIPQPHPDVNKCACKGTGVITHGDGHTTPCPYHGNKDFMDWYNDQQSELNELRAESLHSDVAVCDIYDCHCNKCDCTADNNCRRQEVNILRKVDRPINTNGLASYQLIIFTDDWSSECQDQLIFLKKFDQTGIKVGTTVDADIRLLNVGKYRDFYEKHKGDNVDIPLFIEVKDNKIISKRTGSMTANQIVQTYDLEE